MIEFILYCIGGLLFLLLARDLIYPRWYYEYRRIKAGCGSIDKELDWPFGFRRLYKKYKSIQNMTALDIYKPPRSQRTTLTQLNTYFILDVADPENLKTILSTKFNDYSLSDRHVLLSPLLGNGIFTVEGETWKQQRTMLRPIFTRERVSKLDMLESHFKGLYRKISTTEGYLDMQKIFFSFTTGTALHFLFDLDFDCFSGENPILPTTKGPILLTTLFQALARVSRFLVLRRLLARVQRFVYTRQFREDLDIAHSFADAIVDRVLSEKYQGQDRDFFIAQAAKISQDRMFLRDQAFTMLVAGLSTTASFLTHLALDLSQHPEKYQKLREAVLTDLGTSSSEITFEKLKACSYLANCLNESLRLHPNVPIGTREAKRDTVLPRGGGPDGTEPVFVPKGVLIHYNVYGLQRNPDIWGEDADVFRPERWDENKAAPWTFLPFNGGPRICLGQQFALNETGYILARLCQEFTELKPGEIITEKRYKFEHTLTIKVFPSVDVKWVH